ncbi:SpoIIE family protein phosphatase [Puniceicoccaceae bacterium K14]|nr:SpoIIE family protein phosphatase [Puniceicoccaceae bacterium K14]
MKKLSTHDSSMGLKQRSINELENIVRNLLGGDGSDGGDETITVTKTSLKAALSAAYEAGQTRKHLAVLDPKLDSSLLFWQLMEWLPDYVYFKDLQGRFICINSAMARFFNINSPEEAVGKSDFDFFTKESATEKFEAEQEIIRSGAGWSFREESDLKVSGAEKWVLSTKLPLHDADGNVCGVFGISHDITAKKFAEENLERQRHLLDTIVQILPCRIFVRDTEGKFLLINEEYRRTFGLISREHAVGHRLDEFSQNDRVRRIRNEDLQVIHSGKAISNHIDFDQSVLGEKSWVMTSKVPLISPDGEVEGVVGMTLDVTEQKEAENEARAAQAALKVENERFEKELLVARQLQERLMAMGFGDDLLLSRKGENWDFEASYLYKPSHHLAGDFFYLVPISKERIGILVCDVMGHGVKAALVTMLLRGLMLEDPELLTRPEHLLKHLNDNLVQLAENDEFPRFVTAVYSVINLEKGRIRMANAGHPMPIWRVADENGARYEEFPVEESGPALGLLEGEEYVGGEFYITQESELIFYTDGIIEQKMADGSEFGVERFEELVLNHESNHLPDQLAAVLESLKDSAHSNALSDDVCVIAVRVKPSL